MKKLVFILAIAAIIFQSCGASQAKDKGNESENTSVTPVETVAMNDTEGGSVNLNKETFLKEVWDYNTSPQEWKFKGDKPAIVDFYADWCGPCKIASPILEEISVEYADKIKVYKIDTQVEQELAAVFGISSIPAFLYIPQDGKPVMTAGIGRSKEETKQMFKTNIEKYLLTSN